MKRHLKRFACCHQEHPNGSLGQGGVQGLKLGGVGGGGGGRGNSRIAIHADGLVTAAEGRKQIYRVILPKACITLYSKAGVSNIIVPKQNELKKGLVVSAKNPCVRSLSSQSHSSVCTICTCSSDSNICRASPKGLHFVLELFSRLRRYIST